MSCSTLEFEISEEDTEISFAAPFTQTGAGKLIGTIPRWMWIRRYLSGQYQTPYGASGSVTSSKGVARLTFTGTARGLAEIEGKTRVLTGKLAVKVAIDSSLETATGVYTSSGAASGYGSIKEVGTLDFTWTDVVNSMGNGTWSLEMQLTNDGVKKIGGTARVTLSSGAQFDFTVKGAYKSKTDTSVLVCRVRLEQGLGAEDHPNRRNDQRHKKGKVSADRRLNSCHEREQSPAVPLKAAGQQVNSQRLGEHTIARTACRMP